ncbi:MAG: histidine kinase [Bacteroidales bacterium]|nr:histidine kinase [Bacteroidales bacterium]
MSETRKNSSVQLSIHIIIWGIILFFPMIFIYSEGERNIIRYLDFMLPIVMLMVVFYTNYFLIIKRFLFNKKIWQFFLANLLLFVVCLVLLDLIRQIYFYPYYAQIEKLKNFPHRDNMRQIILFRDIISMSVTVVLSTAIRMTTQWYQSQAEQKELEKLHIESELHNLKHQLNPHFLFNTLNNIYSLISINQENAQNAVHQLSNLIRYVLFESDHPKVQLSKDLNFTTNYIKLMSLRLPSHVKLETEIMSAAESITIAPLLFISLVENAFKHGVSPTEASHISVRISMTGVNELECRVENSNFPKPEADKSGSGIGLNNLRKRLELIYPGSFKLNVEEKGESYISTLTINIGLE